MHPRNVFRTPPDFKRLGELYPDLQKHLIQVTRLQLLTIYMLILMNKLVKQLYLLKNVYVKLKKRGQ